MTRLDFVATMGQKLVDRGFPVRVVNQTLAPLWSGEIDILPRKKQMTLGMLELDKDEQIEWRRHFPGGD